MRIELLWCVRLKSLTPEQLSRYGRFSDKPTKAQLVLYFHLSDAERALIDQRRVNPNNMGFALQLAAVRILSTFLPNPTDVPSYAIEFVGR